MISDPREMCDPHGIPRPVLPRRDVLQCEIRHVLEPRSNVLPLRPRRLRGVLQSPGSAPHDWASDPEVAGSG
jgi:hypothetical protein